MSFVLLPSAFIYALISSVVIPVTIILYTIIERVLYTTAQIAEETTPQAHTLNTPLVEQEIQDLQESLHQNSRNSGSSNPEDFAREEQRRANVTAQISEKQKKLGEMERYNSLNEYERDSVKLYKGHAMLLQTFFDDLRIQEAKEIKDEELINLLKTFIQKICTENPRICSGNVTSKFVTTLGEVQKVLAGVQKNEEKYRLLNQHVYGPQGNFEPAGNFALDQGLGGFELVSSQSSSLIPFDRNSALALAPVNFRANLIGCAALTGDLTTPVMHRETITWGENGLVQHIEFFSENGVTKICEIFLSGANVNLQKARQLLGPNLLERLTLPSTHSETFSNTATLSYTLTQSPSLTFTPSSTLSASPSPSPSPFSSSFNFQSSSLNYENYNPLFLILGSFVLLKVKQFFAGNSQRVASAQRTARHSLASRVGGAGTAGTAITGSRGGGTGTAGTARTASQGGGAGTAVHEINEEWITQIKSRDLKIIDNHQVQCKLHVETGVFDNTQFDLKLLLKKVNIADDETEALEQYNEIFVEGPLTQFLRSIKVMKLINQCDFKGEIKNFICFIPLYNSEQPKENKINRQFIEYLSMLPNSIIRLPLPQKQLDFFLSIRQKFEELNK